MEIKQQLPKLYHRAAISPNSYNKEKRTIEVVFSTGAEVERGFFSTFYESLSLEPGHVRLDRLKKGAPFLKEHRDYSLSSVLGVVEDAHVDGKEGHALIRFSNREDIEPILKDIEDGILRNVSVGYVVHKFTDISDRDEKGEVKKRRMKAVDWEPTEISLVPVGADSNAQIRGQAEESYPVIIERTDMAEKLNTAESEQKDTAPTLPLDVEKVRKEAIEAERKRAFEIRECVKKARLSSELAEDLVAKSISIEQARALIIDKIAETALQYKIDNNRVDLGEKDATLTRREAVANSLLNRFDGNKFKLIESARQYRNMNLLEIAKRMLEWQGVNISSLDKNEIARRALHTTSDFPIILSEVVNKTLRAGYEATVQTFTPFVRFRSVSDFKTITSIQMSESFKLEKLQEDGTYKRDTMKEAKETYKLATYGKAVGITRQVILNDDLDAFSRIPQMYGVAASQLESDLIWGIVTDNAAMGDGFALFHANHGNLAASGAAISVATLSDARKAMRLQKGLDGRTVIMVTPRFLVVPCALETVAQQFIAVNIKMTSTKPADVNPFAGSIEVIAESRLDAASSTVWYLFAREGEANIPMIEVATLDGSRGPMLDTRNGFEIDGVEIKATYDIAAKAIDYRGFYKNPGA